MYGVVQIVTGMKEVEGDELSFEYIALAGRECFVRYRGSTVVVQNWMTEKFGPAANALVRLRGLLFPWCPGRESNPHNPKVEGF